MWTAKRKLLSVLVLGTTVLGTGSTLVAQQGGGSTGAGAGTGAQPDGTGLAGGGSSSPNTALPGQQPNGSPGLSPGTDGSGAGRASLSELRVRLEAELEKSRRSEKRLKSGNGSQEEHLEQRQKVDILKAQIADERDRLSDDLEILQIQRQIQQISVARAERVLSQTARLKNQNVIGDGEMGRVESDVALETARLNLIDARVAQTRRRLERVNDALRVVAAPQPGGGPRPPVNGDPRPAAPGRTP